MGRVKVHSFLICGCIDKLPGPPQRLRVQVINDNEIMISWDPPVINPHTASSYRSVNYSCIYNLPPAEVKTDLL